MRHRLVLAVLALTVATTACLTGTDGDGRVQTVMIDDADGVYRSSGTGGELRIAWDDDRRVFGLAMTTDLDPSDYDLPPQDAVGLNLQNHCHTTHQVAFNYSGWIENVERRGGAFTLRRDPEFPEHVLRNYRPVNVTAHIRHTASGRRIARCDIQRRGTTEFWIDVNGTRVHETVPRAGVRTR